MLKVVWISAALMALIVAGCGGGSDGGTSAREIATLEETAEYIPKAEFIAQADAICEKRDRERNHTMMPRMKQLSKEGVDLNSKKLREELIEMVIPPLEAMSEELSELGLPQEDTKRGQAVIDQIVAEVETVANDPAAVANEEHAPFQKSSELADAYGMKWCSWLS